MLPFLLQGGQPTDTGTISSSGGVEFKVEMVKNVSGVIHHYGSYTSGTTFSAGETVQLKIHEANRRLNARLHSAGHLLDIAMLKTDFKDLKPGKGNHTSESSFVEYIGAIPAEAREGVVVALNEELKRLIAQNSEVVVRNTTPYDEIGTLCGGSVPDYLPKGATSRVVLISPEGPGCPCGGTHIEKTGELGVVIVTGVKVKKGMTKVSYKLAEAA